MARTKLRDGREGRRRGFAGFIPLALCLLLIAGLPACGLDNPASPNQPGDLTGQNTNQVFSFSGSIGLATISGTLVADDASTVTITATVRDASGNPVPNLTVVTFSTDLGAFLVENSDGEFEPFSSAQARTFGGVASVLFASDGGSTGTANIRASLGQVSATTSVELEPAPLSGTLALSFGPDGNGPTSMTGTGTKAQPFDTLVGATALDADGNPIAGALVEYHFVVDTTGTGDFVTGNDVLTGPSGNATNLLRVSSSGDIAIEASIDDPNTGELVAVSNRIFFTSGVPLVPTLEFVAGGASFAGPPPPAMTYPFTAPIVVTVTDTEGNPQDGLTVRFTIVDDSTDTGASVTTGIGVTNSAGQVFSGIVVPDNASGAGSSVTVVAQIVNTTGDIVATSNIVVATGS